jgi:hypothetical protein
LHHAIVNDAPYKVIKTFVDNWEDLENLESMDEVTFLHWACFFDSPLDVTRLLSSTFPLSKRFHSYDHGYNPLMYALSLARPSDVIECMSYSSVEYIGDYQKYSFMRDDSPFHAGNCQFYLVHLYLQDRNCNQTALFRLRHNDPTLTRIILGDSFRSVDGSFFDSLHSHQYLTELFLAWDDEDSNLWSEGQFANNCLITLLRDKKTITTVEVRTSTRDLTPIGDVLQHCPQLRCVRIAHSGSYGTSGIGSVIRRLNELPVLEEVGLCEISITEEDALVLYNGLLKKKSIKTLMMLRPSIHYFDARKLLGAITNDPRCNHLTTVSFFGQTDPNPSCYFNVIGDYECPHLHEIDLEVFKITRRNRIRLSVNEFLDKVCHPHADGQNTFSDANQFLKYMLEADERDKKEDGDPPPDHLYALLKANPEYMAN